MALKNEFKAVLILSLVVLGFSGLSLASLLDEGPQPAGGSTHQGRAPASVGLVPDVAASVGKTIAQPQSLTVDCKELKTAQFSTTADRIQIKGRNCNKQTKNVTNVSTGYTASIFFPKGEFFITDFIQLKEGKNQIQLAGASGGFFEVVVKRERAQAVQ